MLEEMHYYPFGLTMAGISSKALNGAAENKIKFQDQEFSSKEFSDGSGLDMYEFKWRMHDPQIGRFWQVDPLAEKYLYNSTYAFSENKVVVHRELEGLEAEYIFGKLWEEVNGNLRSLGRSVDNFISYVTDWSSSTETSSKTIGNVKQTESQSLTISKVSSLNLEGKLDYIIRNNTNEGSPESWFKTTTKKTAAKETTTEIKTKKVTITNKNSVDLNNGDVTSETSIKVNKNGVDLQASASASTNGETTAKVQGSGGISNGNANLAIKGTTGPNGTNVKITVGLESKTGKTTTKTSSGVQINIKR
jgi:RHS repeat-associated protein